MIVTIDFETYYDRDYSLSKMSEAAYILDPRFETIGCAVKEGSNPSDMFFGFDRVRDRLIKIDWSRAALLAHNTRFDGSILSWLYGFQPKLWLDTLSMARATTHAWKGRSSLAAVSDYLGLPAKGNFVSSMLGVHLADMSSAQITDYSSYCLRDNDNCYDIFQRLRHVFDVTELELIDLMLRMHIEPAILLDPTALAEHLGLVRAEKAAAMGRVAHIDRAVFSSNAKFAALLEANGVDVPLKISKTTGQETYALAKNDRAFKELCSDPDQPTEVQALLAARLGAKSTIEESRTVRLLDHALRPWGENGEGWLAVPMRYYGAHTGRASHDGGINMGNLKRNSGIKKGIRAPDGYRIIHRDSSQIEARMNAWLAGCDKQTMAFARGDDIYSIFASLVFGLLVTSADKPRRFVGKTSILGLGYGMGHERFRHTLFIGNGGMSYSIDEEEARRIVYAYRREYAEIKDNNWNVFDVVVTHMAKHGASWEVTSETPDSLRPFIKGYNPNEIARSHNPRMEILDFRREGIIGPNGLGIAYPNLRVQKNTNSNFDQEIFYDDPYGTPTKLFGGKITENVIQYLARIVVTNVAVRVKRETGYHPSFFTHDSLDYVVPENEVQWWDSYLDRQFAVVPDWAPGLPLASEGGWGVTLAQAENHENV